MFLLIQLITDFYFDGEGICVVGVKCPFLNLMFEKWQVTIEVRQPLNKVFLTLPLLPWSKINKLFLRMKKTSAFRKIFACSLE